MPQSYVKIFVHITTHTKYNYPYLYEGIHEELFRYIGGTLKKLGSEPVQIGGVEDHIHVLCTLPRTISIAKLVEEFKRSSSSWLKTKSDRLINFHWQDGYGAFSVSSSKVKVVKNYILNQKEHHKKLSFWEEYKIFLKEYNIPYDEKYL